MRSIIGNTNLLILTHWIVKLAYLNILWFLFCILGVGIFGWAPATVGLFTILSKWKSGEKCAIFPTFYSIYKKEFINSNISGVIILFLAILFLLNFRTLSQIPVTKISSLFLIGNGTLFILFILSLLFFFPIYIHYSGEFRVIVQKIFLITLGKLPLTIFALILSFTWVTVLFRFPGLIIFFSVSILALIITLISPDWLIKKNYY